MDSRYKRTSLSEEAPVARAKPGLAAGMGCGARLQRAFRAGADAEVGARRQAGSRRRELGPHRAQASVEGGGGTSLCADRTRWRGWEVAPVGRDPCPPLQISDLERLRRLVAAS
jgi:hypothetical protein